MKKLKVGRLYKDRSTQKICFITSIDSTLPHWRSVEYYYLKHPFITFHNGYEFCVRMFREIQ